MTSADPNTVASRRETTRGAAGADWIDQLYTRAPLPPWGVGLSIALAMLAASALLTGLTGELGALLARDESVFSNRNFRLGLILPFLVAYWPTAHHYLALATRRNLLELARATGAAPPQPEVARHGWVVVPTAIFLTAGIALLIDRDPSLYFRAYYWTGGSVGNWVVGFLNAALLLRSIRSMLVWSRSFSHAADHIGTVDLIDRGWLAPFARQGLVCALAWLIPPAIWSFNLGDAPVMLVLIPMSLLCAAVGIVALWLPTAGARRRLLHGKQAELSRVQRALHGDREAMRTLAVGTRDSEPSVADLLAYERFVREVSTMPFDQASWIRFGLYLALPFGSWLGGAFVERAVSGLLD